jgi:hypothetical protein
VSGELLDFHDDNGNSWNLSNDWHFALVKDRLFKLDMELYTDIRLLDLADLYNISQYHCYSISEYYRYSISEYQFQRSKPHWVKLDIHKCGEFGLVKYGAEYYMRLYACNGFLQVVAVGRKYGHPNL